MIQNESVAPNTGEPLNAENMYRTFPRYGTGLYHLLHYLDGREMKATEAVDIIVGGFPPELRDSYDTVKIPLVCPPDVQSQVLERAQTLGFYDANAQRVGQRTLNLSQSSLGNDYPTSTIFKLPPKEKLQALQEADMERRKNFKQRVLQEVAEALGNSEWGGEGHSSYLVRSRTSKYGDVALKMFTDFFFSPDETRKRRDEELEFFKRLSGGPFPEVVPDLLDSLHIPEVFLPMKYVEGQDVQRYVEEISQRYKPRGLAKFMHSVTPGKQEEPVSEAISRIMASAIDAVDFAHKRQIVLLDLETGNWRGNWSSDIPLQRKHGFPITFLDVGSAKPLTAELAAGDKKQIEELDSNLRSIYRRT